RLIFVITPTLDELFWLYRFDIVALPTAITPVCF
ncbi:unnamed protein product, partial [marine sediment metagenome]